MKESLKLLDKIYTNENFKSYFCNLQIIKLLDNIKPELKMEEDSLNKKYLNIRHDVFHYNTKDVNLFIKANKELEENGISKVVISINDGKYEHELAVDILTLTKYFSCKEIPKEIAILYDDVLKIVNLILTTYVMKLQKIN